MASSYTYPAFPAIDPTTGRLITNTSGKVYAVGDYTFSTPLPVTDLSGTPLRDNLVPVGPQALTAEFITDQDEVVWKSGDYVLHLWSPRSLLDTARQAEQTARDLAEALQERVQATESRMDALDAELDAAMSSGSGGAYPFKRAADYADAGPLGGFVYDLPDTPAGITEVLDNNDAIFTAALADRPELWTVGPLDRPVPSSLKLEDFDQDVRLKAWLEQVVGDTANGRPPKAALDLDSRCGPAINLASVGFAQIGPDNPDPNTFTQTCSALTLATGQGSYSQFVSGDVLEVASKDATDWSATAMKGGSATVWRAEYAQVHGPLLYVTGVSLAAAGNPATLERHQLRGSRSGALALLNGWALDTGGATAKAVLAAVSRDFEAGEDLIDVASGAIIGQAGAMRVALNGWLDFAPYTTEPQVRVLDAQRQLELDVRVTFNIDPDRFIKAEDRAPSVGIGPVAYPKVKVRVDNVPSRAVIIKGTFMGTVDVIAHGIPNHALAESLGGGVANPYSEGAYGYGVESRGCTQGTVVTVQADHLRHAFTTNPNGRTWEVDDRAHTDYGAGAHHVLVKDSVVLNSYAAGMDTHAGCFGVMFHDIYVGRSMGGGRSLTNGAGFNNRGLGTSYADCTAMGGFVGFSDGGAAMPTKRRHQLTYANVKALNYESRGFSFGQTYIGVLEDGTTGFGAKIKVTDALARGDGSAKSKPHYQTGFDFRRGDYELHHIESERFNGVPIWIKDDGGRYVFSGSPKTDYAEGEGSGGVRVDGTQDLLVINGRWHCNAKATGVPLQVFDNRSGNTMWQNPDGVLHTSAADKAGALATPPTVFTASGGSPEYRGPAAASSGSSAGSGGATVTPAVHEPALNLARVALTESELRPVHITCVGDSITWGVGSDGLADQVSPFDQAQQDTYRERSWPAQLGKLLAGYYGGGSPTKGWQGPPTAADGGGWASGTATGSFGRGATSGAFGGHGVGGRGGATVGLDATKGAGVLEFPASKLGAFTELLVEFYGGDAGVYGPSEPTVIVDGQVIYTGSPEVPGGVLNRLRFTGLSDQPHTVQLTASNSGKTAYVAGIIPTRSTGVVVNRVASPGATSGDAIGTTYTAQQQQRVIEAEVKPGLTDLLILALGTNDYGAQTPLADYKANLLKVAQPVLDAGGTVLLLGGPTPRNNGGGAIPESAYDDAAAALASSTPRMAFVSVRTLLQSRALGDASGQFVSLYSVHPSRRGHATFARALFNLLVQPLTPGMALTDALPAPAAPRGITAGATTATTQALSWAATPATGRYLVERQAAGETAWTTVADTDATSVVATGLTPATRYAYRVTARSMAGSSTPSPTTSRTTAAA